MKRFALLSAKTDGEEELWLTDDSDGCDESQDFTPWDEAALVTFVTREDAESRAGDAYCTRYRASVVEVEECPGGRYERSVPPADRSKRCTVGEAVAPGVANTETRPDGQQKGYVILCDDERKRGFVRPVRRTYLHTKCGTTTTMGQALAETYARDPKFYSGTFCVACKDHFPVGADGDFVWNKTSEKVGT